MNAEAMRNYLLSLPHVSETEQFGGLVYWVADRAVGGRMLAMLHPDGDGSLPISYPAGPEHFAELLEQEGMRPAPYLARAYWVAAERWDVLRNAEWERELLAAHGLILAKLPPKARKVLALPAAERRRAITEARRKAAAKVAAAAK